MDYLVFVGLLAGALTTISFLPQAVKIFRTKSAKDISLHAFAILDIGTFIWILYGFGINSIPVIATNVFTFLLVSAIVILKLKSR